MSFSKRTIKDRVATGDNKFVNSGDALNLVLTPNPDSVSEAGTSVNADLLQRYENALYAVGNRMDGGTSTGNDTNNDHANGIMGTKMTVRADTKANWESNNPVLAKGEFGFDSTSKLFKVGDGTTSWNNLRYFNQIDITRGNNLPSSNGGYSAIGTSGSTEFEVELVPVSNGSFDLYHILNQKYNTEHNLIQSDVKWCKIHGYFFSYTEQGNNQTKVNILVYGVTTSGTPFTVYGDYATYIYTPSYSPSGYIAVYASTANIVKQIVTHIR